MRIKSQKDFGSGLMFVAAGLAFAWRATEHAIVEGGRVGAADFPLVLGVLLAALGAFILYRSLLVETEDGDRIGRWAWRPLLFVTGANVAFGALIGGLPAIGLPAMGLIVAVYALTIIATLARRGGLHWRSTLVLATVLAAASYIAFVLVLKLPMQVWPAFAGA